MGRKNVNWLDSYFEVVGLHIGFKLDGSLQQKCNSCDSLSFYLTSHKVNRLRFVKHLIN
jgi:hypothetical protein